MRNLGWSIVLVLLGAACSSATTAGSSNNNDNGGGGGGGSCGSVGVQFPAACEACHQAKCCNERKTCAGIKGCSDCISGTTCDMESAQSQELSAFLNCESSQCASECAAGGGGGGGGGSNQAGPGELCGPSTTDNKKCKISAPVCCAPSGSSEHRCSPLSC